MGSCVTHHICDCLKEKMERLERVAEAAALLDWEKDRDLLLLYRQSPAVQKRLRLLDALAALKEAERCD